MKQYHKLGILLFLLAFMVSASAAMSERDCRESGGWFGIVYSNPLQGPNEVTTPVLNNGDMYSVTTWDHFYLDTRDQQNQVTADAQFYQINDGPWLKPVLGNPVHSFLQINNNDVNWGTTVNLPDHEYTVEIAGQGSPVTLRIKDWYDNEYTYNYCHQVVCIIPEDRDGCTPGFWKNHLNAWPAGISTGDTFTDNPFAFVEPVDLNGDGNPETYLQALSYKGGSTINGARMIFLRAVVAGELNYLKFGFTYPGYDQYENHFGDISNTYRYGSREALLRIAELVDGWNNAGCPL
jgi:hypothetical protein